MIPEYKRFQGAVLAEIVDSHPGAVSIQEWPEKGRLSCYILNGTVGLHIKHSGARMRPWQFTFTEANFASIEILGSKCQEVFVVLVCWLDGMVCLTRAEFKSMVAEEAGRAWVRVERRRGEWYTVSGPRLELDGRKPNGIDCLIDRLGQPNEQPRRFALPRISSVFRVPYLRRLWGGNAGSA